MRTLLTLLTSLFFATLTFAEPLIVNGVQAPAWLEKNGSRVALKPSMAVEEEDVVVTSAKGKAWLTMVDGATIKLGNNSRMILKSSTLSKHNSNAGEDTETVKEDSSFLEASLDILEGAFRYTTDKLDNSSNWRRKVEVGMVTATIGIRGTDLWGQVESDKQFVVLLEGKIEIQPKNASDTVALDQPLQIFSNDEIDGQAVASVDMSAVEKLAPETELDFGNGVSQKGGQYTVNLASFKNQHSALGLVQNLSDKGYGADIREIDIGDNTWYRVTLQDLTSKDDARAIIAALSGEKDISGAWAQ